MFSFLRINAPPLPPKSPLYSGGETTDFLPAPSVCFSKRQSASIYRFSMFHITETSQSNVVPTPFPLQSWGKHFFFIIIIFIYRSNPSYVLDFSLTDSVGFAAGSQSAAVGDPLLEQPEPRRPAQPCPAAGPRLPLPGKSCGACGCGADKRKIKGAKSSRREQQKVQHRE